MNKKYDDLLENDGILISNTSLSEVTDGMNRGEYTQEHYDKIKKIMTASVTQTLAKRGNVDEGNIETIASLLDKGLTPTQVVAKL
ncbi:MAG: hypothetical protein GY827_04150 [Cytophagales bacterium]|nr:hypothetical protein [Cytophagales bacterium]